MTINLDTALSALLSGLMGVFLFLARHYFDRTHKDILELKGALQMMIDGLHKNTITVAKLQQDVKALWRFADGAFGRVSDRTGEKHGDDS